MHPLITVGSFEIMSYALCTVCGAVLAAVTAFPGLKRAGFSGGKICLMLGCMCISFLAGARLWNVAVSPGSYGGKLRWYTPKLRGLSLYGGILGAFAALLLSCRIGKRPAGPALDAVTVPGALAFCVSRIGCFLNDCCAGKPTDGCFGVIFPKQREYGALLQGWLSVLPAARPVHPTQLYEFFGAAVGIPLILFLCRRLRLKEGARFLLYGAWFSAVRLFVLPLRVLNYPEAVVKFIYPALYLSLIIAGLWITVRREKGSEKEELPRRE